MSFAFIRLEHRIPPPFLALGTAVAMWGLSRLGPPSSIPWQRRAIIAALLVIAAAVFVAPAIRAFRRAATTINPAAPDTAGTLVTTGIYQVTRNPMYVALALLLTAWAAWLCQLLPLLGPIAFLAYITRFQIIPEERALGRRFGDAYTAYTRSVRRWL